MGQNDFWKLFAETGEPVYWLLCRGAQAENIVRTPPRKPEPEKGSAPPTPS